MKNDLRITANFFKRSGARCHESVLRMSADDQRLSALRYFNKLISEMFRKLKSWDTDPVFIGVANTKTYVVLGALGDTQHVAVISGDRYIQCDCDLQGNTDLLFNVQDTNERAYSEQSAAEVFEDVLRAADLFHDAKEYLKVTAQDFCQWLVNGKTGNRLLSAINETNGVFNRALRAIPLDWARTVKNNEVTHVIAYEDTTFTVPSGSNAALIHVMLSAAHGHPNYQDCGFLLVPRGTTYLHFNKSPYSDTVAQVEAETVILENGELKKKTEQVYAFRWPSDCDDVESYLFTWADKEYYMWPTQFSPDAIMRNEALRREISELQAAQATHVIAKSVSTLCVAGVLSNLKTYACGNTYSAVARGYRIITSTEDCPRISTNCSLLRYSAYTEHYVESLD